DEGELAGLGGLQPGNAGFVIKAAQRASGFAVVGIAVCLRSSSDGSCDYIAVGVTGVTDKAYRAEHTENMLKGRRLDPRIIEEAAAEVTHGLDVMEDINASPEYRSHLARVYVARAIDCAMKS
ncbi:MAG: xanthine dehydrogenase family protein subunit M, partial [Deltaproteobacteria bacterium]|nr:xanthine dehydrogenase family protein subunit M [Deltaproteobacteria bacterium]